MNDLYIYERELALQGYQNIVGVDEVGRGPMAGPLVAAAVILDPGKTIIGLNDSKKLSPKKRDYLYEIIMSKAIAVGVAFIDVKEVDKINVYQASKKAMKQAIMGLKTKVDYILADAMNLDLATPSLSIIKGDSKSASIAAASIVAKVLRDQYMKQLQNKYPLYSFSLHKGYVTKAHLAEIATHGLTPEHRRSFSPVRKILEHK